MIQSLLNVVFGGDNKLRVQLDRDLYYTGDEISGCLTLELTEQLVCDEIFLRLKGTEHVHYDECQTKTTGKSHEEEVIRHSQTLSFLDRKIVLSAKTTNMPPGLHQMPFRLAALDDTPSSFKHESHDLQGKITYTIKAEVPLHGFFQRNLRSEPLEFRVRQIPRVAVMPSQLVAEAPITAYWCCGNGSVELAAVSDKNMYAPGDKIQLRFAMDPQNSAKKIKSVSVSLRRVLRFGTSPNVYSQQREQLLSRVDSGPITQHDTLERRVVLSVPMGEFFTLKSSLIECHYEVVFGVKAEWCFVAKIKHPIEIHDFRLPEYSSIDIPEKCIS